MKSTISARINVHPGMISDYGNVITDDYQVVSLFDSGFHIDNEVPCATLHQCDLSSEYDMPGP